MLLMGDATRSGPDHKCLFETASAQHGYFTSGQGRACGFARDLLSRHAHSGRFVRVRRGLYRLRDYPSFPREEVVAAWLAVGKDSAVVSHASALELLDLSDVIPNAIHLTVPRTRRNLPSLPGVRIHTTTRQFGSGDITVRHGIRLTAAARTILDAAEKGVAPDQIELAVAQAIERGMVSADYLQIAAGQRGRRVVDLIAGALIQVAR